jgi:glycosyltransferase involved in cell wall biosynthesis
MMQKAVEISVIIPAYNVEKHIFATLNSLREQTFTDFEIIVINDGSKDKTLEEINRFRSEFCGSMTVIDRENRGVSRSRNEGIDISAGKYLSFVDGDDTVEPYFLDLMHKTIIENRSDLVYTGYKEIDTYGNILKKYSDRYEYTDGINTGKYVLEKYLRGRTYMYTWSVLFDKKIILDNHIRFHEDISYGEDQIFNYETLLKCNSVSCVKKELINYLRHDEGTMQKLNNLKYLSILRSLYRFEKHLIESGEEKELIKAVKYYKTIITTIMILTNWAAIGESDKYRSLLKRKIIRNFLKRTFFINPFIYYKLTIKSILLLIAPRFYFNSYIGKKKSYF